MSQQVEYERLKERENQAAIDRQFSDEEEDYELWHSVVCKKEDRA